MSTVEPATDQLGDELRKLADLGVVEYYLPSDPEGERYVVGVQGQILNLSPDEAGAFLAGATAVALLVERKAGWLVKL